MDVANVNDEATPRAVHRVMVVDDHPIVREGISRLIDQQEDLSVSAEAANIEAALCAVAQLKHELDVVIVDISLGRESGLDLVKSLKVERPHLPVLVLSMHDELLFADRALRVGASGYIMKQEGTDLLLNAIRKVLRGEVYVSPTVNGRVLQSMMSGGKLAPTLPMASLTNREIDVFRLIGNGLGTREIARQLSLSVKTVESHRSKIKDKLGLRTATELVVQAAHWVSRGEV